MFSPVSILESRHVESVVPNKALQRTALALRANPAAELGRWTQMQRIFTSMSLLLVAACASTYDSVRFENFVEGKSFPTASSESECARKGGS